MSPEEAAAAFGGSDPFSDFFHTFFGGSFGDEGAAAGRAPRSTRGRDVEGTVELTLEEAFSGTTRRLRSTSRGSERTVEVRIPAGVHDGARVRAAGEGGRGHGHGGAAGDLYLHVHLLPHPVFDRRGRDLHVRVDVPLTTAVLGGEVSVPAISGPALRLKVPEVTPQGRVFRLRGHGMPTLGRPDERGDLLVAVQIQMPSRLTAEARRHFEALKALDEHGAAAGTSGRNES
jgi:DnaJ-class molecular chaperone